MGLQWIFYLLWGPHLTSLSLAKSTTALLLHLLQTKYTGAMKIGKDGVLRYYGADKTTWNFHAGYLLAIALTAKYTQNTIHRYPRNKFIAIETPNWFLRPGWPWITTLHKCYRTKSNMDAASGEGVTSKWRKYEYSQIWKWSPNMEKKTLAPSFKFFWRVSRALPGNKCGGAENYKTHSKSKYNGKRMDTPRV